MEGLQPAQAQLRRTAEGNPGAQGGAYVDPWAARGRRRAGPLERHHGRTEGAGAKGGQRLEERGDRAHENS